MKSNQSVFLDDLPIYLKDHMYLLLDVKKQTFSAVDNKTFKGFTDKLF